MADFLDTLRRIAALQPQQQTPMPPQMTPAAPGTIPAQSPFGNQRFGGLRTGGNTFGGNTPQSLYAGIQGFLKNPLIAQPGAPAAPPVTVQAGPPPGLDIPLPQDTPPPGLPEPSRQGGYGAAPTPAAPPMPAPQHVSGEPQTPFMQTLMQQDDVPADPNVTDRGAWSAPADSGPAAPSATSAGRSLLDRIMGSDDPSTRDRHGLTQAQRHGNAFDAISKLGFTLMAAGMPQSPNQSAQIMSGLNPAGDLARGRSAIMAQNAAAQQAEQRDLAMAVVKDARAVMQSPDFQEAYKNMPASMQALARAAAATGDVRALIGMMHPRAVKGGYVDPATGQFIPTGGTGAGAGKVTEFQAKNAQYFAALDHSNATLNKFESEGSDLYNQVVDKYVPGVVSNYFKSEKADQYFTAQKVWAEQVLRLATGAAAPQAEQEQYRTLWFPQPGESAASIASKRELRAKITEQIRQNAGGALGQGKAADHFDSQGNFISRGSSGGQPQPQPAEGPEPDKYDYRRMPDGSLQQRLKR